MFLKILVGTVILLVFQHVVRLVYFMGFHRHYNNHYPGHCKVVEGIGLGPEDFHVFQDGVTFIASGFRLQEESAVKAAFMKENSVSGRMYLFHFNTVKAEELTINEDNGFNLKRFHPQGMSGWVDEKSGEKFLYVVNHEQDGVDYIEKFLYVPQRKQLQHVKRFRDDTMTLLNDIQITGEDAFYFTNFGRSTSGLLMALQIFGQIYWNTVVYFDGLKYKIVLSGMAMSNGLFMSNDGRFVYIANSLTEEIIVAERQPNNDLVIVQVYPIYTFPDNVMVDHKTGDLYVGSHPIFYQLFSHLGNPVYRAPSQILKLDVETSNGTITGTKELFFDDGNFITGASTGFIYNSKLIIGSVFDKFVCCDVRIPT